MLREPALLRAISRRSVERVGRINRLDRAVDKLITLLATA